MNREPALGPCIVPLLGSGGVARVWGTLAIWLLLAAVATAQEPSGQEPLGQEIEEPEAAAEQPASEEEGEEPLSPDAVEFDIRLDDGSRVSGSALNLSDAGTGEVVLEGDIRVQYKDIRLRADRMTLDQEAQRAVAEGSVVFDQGPQRLAGDLLELDLESETGRIVNARGSVSTDYFFTGAEVLKTGEDSYRVLNGRFSSCEGDTPAWSFGARRVDLTVDGYAKVRGATFRAKKVPLLYVPYLLWPVKSDRSSGFLVPKPGYSNRRGASLGLAYYWAINRSWDTTLHLDLFAGGDRSNQEASGEYLGFGTEVRYRPSEFTEGRFEGYGIRDPENQGDASQLDEVRWRVKYEHQSRNLPGGLRFVMNVEEASDFEYFRDFERRGDRNSRRQLYSTGYLSGNWGAHSFNLNFDKRETFIDADRTVELRQLPEVEYKLRSTRLGKTPFYLQLNTSMHYLDVDRNVRQQESYARGDFFPEVTLPIRSVPWLSLSLTAGGRVTWYGDSLLTQQEQTVDPERESDFRGQSLTRVTPTAVAEIVGPSISRIYDTGGERFSRFKHVIEPRITYNFLEEDEEQDRVPLFDEVDRVFGSNVARFSLFNRLLAKPAEEAGGGAFEILSFELSQDYSFDEPLQSGTEDGVLKDQSSGPIRALLRYNPSRRTSLRTELRYNTLFGSLESSALSATVGFGPQTRVGVRYTHRQNPVTDQTSTHQVRLATRFFIVPRRLMLDAQVNFDLDTERSLTQFERYLLHWRGSCYDLSFEYGEWQRGLNQVDREFRFSVTLKNVGTFLDINGGESESL